ncbi:ABC transporter, permease protein 2 (cluster 11, riboflavin/purine nucleoside/unknown) [hydrothermal vent metagenome]|uniref:Nucleoside ABC transporter, permease protein 2 n=1 Tax=hydrothermal vent metagenome TaxID=652676 RepID=A0A3B0TRL9_9ZZZZ
MEFFNSSIFLLDSSIRLTVPLLLACLAGLYSERAGIFDIGLEGKMLAGAFAAATVAALSGSALYGLMAGIGVSIVMSLIHGVASITFRGNQIISGVAINFLAAGLTTLLGQTWFRQGGRTPQLSGDARFTGIELPFAAELADVPIIGGIYSELLSGHNILVYVAFAAVPITYYVLFHTRFGLRLRASGENPKAVDTAGVNVNFMRFKAVIITGVLCGIAGAYLSTAQSAGFGNNMTAGKGFIALAALIFAKWMPIRALFATLLFGFLDALQIRLQGVELPMIGEVPVQLIQALPYILTVILLAGFIGKAVGPKAGGIPYVKER